MKKYFFQYLGYLTILAMLCFSSLANPPNSTYETKPGTRAEVSLTIDKIAKSNSGVARSLNNKTGNTMMADIEVETSVPPLIRNKATSVLPGSYSMAQNETTNANANGFNYTEELDRIKYGGQANPRLIIRSSTSFQSTASDQLYVGSSA